MSALLEVAGLSRRFGGLLAVDALGFSVAAGEIVGLLGPNGSGKTTVLNLLSGVLRPDSGTVAFRGHAIAGKPAHRIARLGMARTFQLVRPLASLSCRDNVLTGLAFGRRNAWGAAARAEADALLDRVGPRPRARHAAGRAHLHRPEAPGACPRARARSRAAAARRMAGRPQPDRAGGGHRPDPRA